MRVRWTEPAADDLERIADYLTEHAPATATRDVRAIYRAAEELTRFPIAVAQVAARGRESWY